MERRSAWGVTKWVVRSPMIHLSGELESQSKHGLALQGHERENRQKTGLDVHENSSHFYARKITQRWSHRFAAINCAVPPLAVTSEDLTLNLCAQRQASRLLSASWGRIPGLIKLSQQLTSTLSLSSPGHTGSSHGRGCGWDVNETYYHAGS